jgi:hypothetical protein
MVSPAVDDIDGEGGTEGGVDKGVSPVKVLLREVVVMNRNAIKADAHETHSTIYAHRKDQHALCKSSDPSGQVGGERRSV